VKGDEALPDRMHCNNGRPMELIEKLITDDKDCDMCGLKFEKNEKCKRWKHKNFKTVSKERTIKGKKEII